MRAFWIILGLISMAICIPIIISTINNYKVYTKGNIVEVTILSLPATGVSSKSSGFMKFIYKGLIYDKKINGSNDFTVGQKMRLKYLDGYEDYFLFENENPTYGGIIGFFMLFGGSLYCFYYAYKKHELPPLIKR